MKVRVKYHEAEVEVELPDAGVAQEYRGSSSISMDKNEQIWGKDKRSVCDVAIEVIAQAGKTISAIREGGSHE